MRTSIIDALSVALAGILVVTLAEEASAMEKPTMRVATYKQEVATFYTTSQGLPDDEVYSVLIEAGDSVYAGTAKGLARFSEGKWTRVEGVPEEPVLCLFKRNKGIGAVCASGMYFITGSAPDQAPLLELPPKAPISCAARIEDGAFLFGTDKGAFEAGEGMGTALRPSSELNDLLGNDKRVAAVAAVREMAVAAMGGLFCRDRSEDGLAWNAFQPQYPRNATRSWAPRDVRGVAYDSQGRLWFASAQGVGCRNVDGSWSLYTPEDGLPYDDFTTVAAGGDGAVWFGTTLGAIRFDGTHWAYRQGRRWLPDDHVRAIAVNANGDAWLATAKGVGVIERRPMTLKEKAKFYEDEIDKYHRRTPYGYVIEASLKTPGDKSTAVTGDSDNDGLWTSMYGAGECFAYAATKDPEAKKRAKAAFEALRFLQEVTQGGSNPAPKGFVARSILPTDGPNPNETQYTKANDWAQKMRGDALWKVIWPRWPTSADGKWYWKCDTSSDELDGHYFFYAQYYDLVADTEEEKQRVRDVVVALTDHLIEHDFCLVDWDGQPTRWAVYSPAQLNENPAWVQERGLNSLSMLSYLAVAEHMTGDRKYQEAFAKLVNQHGYGMNLMTPKMQNGPGSNNQSDDEMAFMSFYNLLLYASNPIVKAMASFAFHGYWILEQPELNPFFNFAYAGVSIGASYKDQYMTFHLGPKGAWLEQSVDSLMRFPLDRIDWRHVNSHRKDLAPLPAYRREDDAKGTGYRRNELVIPIDEHHFNHWNYDPWQLDQGGGGRELSDGAVFLLPYYMGLYHGFITEKP